MMNQSIAVLGSCQNYQLQNFWVPPSYAPSPGSQIAIDCGTIDLQDTIERTMRLDPLLSPGETFQHTHTVFGSVNFGSEVTCDDVTLGHDRLALGSCDNPADGSIYWVPTMYYYDRGTNTNKVVPATLSVYYKDSNECTGQLTPLSPMPVGLKMIVGDAHRNYAFAGGSGMCGGDHIDWGYQIGGGLSGFPSATTDKWQVNIAFPSCWDGRNLDSVDHTSHVTYPIDNSMRCPDSHPKRIPKLLGEVHYWVKQYGGSRDDYFLSSRQGGSTEDHEGWTAHMDFIAGWNSDLLDAAIKNCHDNIWTADNCPFHQFYVNGLRPAPGAKPFHKSKPPEDVNNIAYLPHEQGAAVSGAGAPVFLCASPTPPPNACGTPTPVPPSPSPPGPTCSNTYGKDCQGLDLETFVGYSPEECCQYCSQYSGCQAYVFVSGGEWGNKCYLKSGCASVDGCADGGQCTTGVVGPSPPSPPPVPPSPSKLCAGASIVGGSTDWIWNTDAVPSPSCTSPAVENHALMCEGDPTSVVIQGNGGPQCLSAHSACNFHMGNIFQVDFDVSMLGCTGTWAAPLWMTPDEWGTDGASSGEIDMLEMCPSDALYSNFAGGGTQKKWSFADANNFHGHTTMWKRADQYGVQGISVATCISADMIDGACPEVGAAFLPDIYDKHGCHDGNCMYHLISDIWNGNDGDGGYQGCASGQSHSSGGCSFSISNIRFDALPGTFEGKCAALTKAHPTPPPPTPTPPPTPPTPPTPSPTPPYRCVNGNCILGDGGVDLNTCQALCTAPSTFKCVNNQCVAKSGGVAQNICEAVCGGSNSSVI